MNGASNALAARLDAMSRQLRAQGDDLAALRRTVDSLQTMTEETLDRLGEVEQVATSCAQQITTADQPRKARCWSWLAEPQPAHLRELGEWVDRVLIHYPDVPGVLSDCWPLHPWVVEELLALYWAWREAHIGPQAQGVRAIDWHDRHRPGVLTRIAKVLDDCSLVAHFPNARADHRNLPKVDLSQVDEAITWWASVHPEPTSVSAEKGR